MLVGRAPGNAGEVAMGPDLLASLGREVGDTVALARPDDPVVPLAAVALLVPATLVVAAAVGRPLGWGAARRLPAAVLRTE